MAITQLSRLQLNQEFRDGERPSGDDFASAWTSFFHKAEDGFSVNADGNFELSKGVIVKDTTIGQAGTLRFNGGQLQVHDGTGFKNINTGAGGAFAPVTGGVAYAGGNVGIGTSSTLTYKLEVLLGNNAPAATDQRVKFGNLAIHSGASGSPGAYIAHASQAGDPLRYALLQDAAGITTVNGDAVYLSRNGERRVQVVGNDVQLTPAVGTGNVVITGNTTIGANPAILNRNLTVIGNAFKLVAGPFLGTSDSRVKKDIRPYKEGMQKLLALKPVVFKFNGKGQTPDDGKDYVGFVAQDVREVLPELIITRPAKLNEGDAKDTEILNYDLGPVTFIMINAIKELAARLDKLEKPNTDEKRKPKNTARANG